MGRYVSQGFGAGSSGDLPNYVPGRLYTPHGIRGSASTNDGSGLLTSPMRLRPGRWSLSGLWAVAGASGVGAIQLRLGLYADLNGRPGALIKDAGMVTFSSFSVIKATFTPIQLDAPAGMNLHLVAVASQLLMVAATPTGSSYVKVQGDYGAVYGLDPQMRPTVDFQDRDPNMPLGLRVAGVLPTAPLASPPDLAAAVHVGTIYGGLIFA